MAGSVAGLFFLLGGGLVMVGAAVSFGRSSGVPTWARVFVVLFVWTFFIAPTALFGLVFLAR